MVDASLFQNQLNGIVEEYEAALARSKYDDGSDILKGLDVMALQSRCRSAVERTTGRTSTYSGDLERILQGDDSAWGHLASMVGVIKALSHDLQKDYLRSFEELIHASVFADFLEMADYLVAAGYKDAGAVVAGSTLEGHLRKIASKNGIPVATEGRTKNAGKLNAEIAKVGGYTNLDAKNVTAWLDLRNRAAHGRYDGYDKGQVTMFISNIRDFLTRIPA